ncbi:hypothetical protein J3R30DRAFT_3681914 [Lentinula aciculospora]|uniref:NAD-dependent epimerase/dehydratase domain-containing protein n=1 Tax=Lentinula aciculospora TaxID=153920 RepID=A0A9W9AEP9_9AGAR|nr:hypothetical protein J3R30DRAFT_3681914 [Lentinula aciculospora]
MPSDVIFLTGATGFLGSHILNQLLAKGHNVKVAIREKKAVQFKKLYESYQSQLEIVIIDDISTAQFPEALKGVKAIIHTAAPLAYYVTDAEGQLKGAVEGVLNVLRQAEKAGVHKVVVTSTILTAFTPQYTFSTDDWFAITKEEALKTEGVPAYMAAKTLAEKEVWNFADAHPQMDITTINPPYLYGSATKEFTSYLTAPSLTLISTLINVYKLLNPKGAYPDQPLYCDVRDVAKAHIGALSSPPPSIAGRKRIHISSPHDTVFADIIKAVNEKRPELKDRLTKTTPPEFPFKKLNYDSKRVEEVCGLKPEDFVPVNDTFIESIDTLVGLEKQWKAAGYEVQAPQ